MDLTTEIQDKMFQEIQKRDLFDQALKYSNSYLDTAFERNIFPLDEAIDQLSFFEENMPDFPSNSAEILKGLHDYGAPATIAQIGGRYFGFVNGSVVPAALAAKLMADFWDQNPAMYVLSPIASKLEEVVENWLKQLLGLPESTAAGFVSGSSSATFCGLAAARYRILQRKNWDINKDGLYGAPRIRIVAAKQIHGTVLKAIALLGIGTNQIEWVDVDDQGRIIPELIPTLDENTILILQAGNVNSGAFEDFDQICDTAKKANAWVHIDGAFGLWAAGVEKLKHLTKGIEKADSWSVDGHKTLNTPYDCGIALCKDREAFVSALHMSGAYLVLGEQRDGMFYTPEMSRRSRIIELWASMKYLGKQGIDQMVYGMHQRALQFSDELKANNFEVLNDVVFNQVIVYCESDELTEKVMKRVQELRVCWCGGSKWEGKKVIRISVCSWATTAEDVTLSVASFVQARSDVKK